MAITAIVISLLRCEPFTIDLVAVLASILSLSVAILLGIIAYNYFIQKDENIRYKQDLKDAVDAEVKDLYLGLMSSFATTKSPQAIIPLGTKVVERLKEKDNHDMSEVCKILESCYAQLTEDDKLNPVIQFNMSKLTQLLKHFPENENAVKLLSVIDK